MQIWFSYRIINRQTKEVVRRADSPRLLWAIRGSKYERQFYDFPTTVRYSLKIVRGF